MEGKPGCAWQNACGRGRQLREEHTCIKTGTKKGRGILVQGNEGAEGSTAENEKSPGSRKGMKLEKGVGWNWKKSPQV